MKFSTSIEYAIHGLVYLAEASAAGTTLISDIARAIGVPEAYLRKVFQQLVRSGIVTSKRGVRGGFCLAREPELITLKDVVEAIDGSMPLYSCLRLQRGCRLSQDCPVREVFEEARQRMAEILAATSIKDLLNDLSKQQNEVTWLKIKA